MTVLYSVIVLKLKSKPTPGEHFVNAAQQREKRERNVHAKIGHCYCVKFCNMLDASYYYYYCYYYFVF